MKHRILSVVLALCLCMFPHSEVHAFQDDSFTQENVYTEETAGEPVPHDNDSAVPAPAEVYEAMIALKEQDAYKEETIWTDDEPYSDTKGYYNWKGGSLGGKNIVAVGCVAFAFILSDTAFGSLPARMYAKGEFTFEDIKVGDILRMNTDTHTVIVLEVNDAGVVVAEGNYSGKVHWGRAISKDEVMMNTSHYITRYPEGYVSPDDPGANDSIANGTLNGGLSWNLTKAGTLTISGRGAMPDFSSAGEQPWKANNSKIRRVVIGNGVTSIGSCAFGDCGVLSAEIASSVTTIGNSAFRGSSLIAVSIPSSVKTIGDSAFQKCQNLSSVTVSEGVENIGQNAFQACTSLASIDLPASIGEVGAGAFFQCTSMTDASFASGSKRVKIGDNMFTQCYQLMSVTLPTSIDRIGAGMFQNCGMLAGVEIPQGAESIEGSAFASSGVTVLIIPDSVTSIGIAAFSACPLKDIYFTGTEAQWNRIGKMGDTVTTLSKATIHYNYTPGENTPGEDQPGDNKPDENQPDNSKPGDDQPGNNKPDSNKPGSDQPGESKPGENEPGNNQPGNNRPDDNQPGNSNTEQDARPDTGVPFIKDENGKSGWDVIRAEEETVGEGSVIHVDMNSASVVPGDIFGSIKGRDITITFDMGNGILWSVDGKSITAEQVNDIDLSVRTGTNTIPADIINPVAGEGYRLQLSLSHEGEFGFTAVLSINLSKENARRTAVLYYYDPNAKALELMCKEKIAEDGTVGLTFTHASEYLITVDNVTETGTGTDTDNKNMTSDTQMKAPETGDRDHGRMWGIMMAGALAVIIGTIFKEKGKDNNFI